MAVTKASPPKSRLAKRRRMADRKITNQCIHTLVDEQAVLQPHACAIDAHDGSYSFAELSAASWRLSEYLRRLGVHREARVAILMEKSAFYPLAILAVLKSGGVFVPLDPNHPQKRLQQLIQDIRPVVLISSTTSQQKASSLHDNVLLVDNTNTWCCPAETISPSVDSNDAAYIIFTSGSTGKPKGVLVEHGAFLASALARGSRTGICPESRVLQYAAHTFDVSIDEILTTLVHGGCVCIPLEADRFLLAPVINRFNVNHALLTPTSAKMLDPDEVPTLKTLQLGGELLSDEVIQTWSTRVRLFNVYGPAEASVACIMIEKTQKDEPGNVIGHPVGSICRIVDPDNHDRVLAPGVVGELIIGGRILAREYYNDPVKTAASFIPAPSWATSLFRYRDPQGLRFYKTGDLAQMNENGLTTIHGRKDNQVKVRGQRINVEEVECALLATELIQSVVVDLPKKGPLANKLIAILCTKSSMPSAHSSSTSDVNFSSAKEVEEHLQSKLYHELRNTLTSAMVPSKWIQLPCLPQNSSTKTDRKPVRAWVEEMDDFTFQCIFEPNSSKHVNVRKPNDLDPTYERILCKVLGVESTQLRPDISFIRNGGDSIAAIELCRLGKEAGMSFWIGDILSTCNLQELFGLLGSRQEKQLVIKDEHQPGVPFPLSPVQEFFFDHMGDGKNTTFVQSVDLELKESIGLEKLKKAMDSLVSMHPMLRARFERHSGTWVQVVSSDIEGSYSISSHQTCQAAPPPDAVRPPSASVTLDRVFHVQYWECDAGQPWLQLSAHHLIVDLVSWRIILDDLAKLLREESSLSSTMSFQTWCSLQSEYAKTLNPDKVLPFPVLPSNWEYWNSTGAQNTHGSTAHTCFTVGKSAMNSLLGSTHEVQPVDIMLGSFYKAFSDNFQDRETPTVFIESHGREVWHSSIDISQTVGWFTTAYPVHVPSDLASGLESAVLQTTQRRRAVPANGHPYWCDRFLGSRKLGTRVNEPAMEFVFNFAGQFRQAGQKDLPFRTLSTIGKETASVGARRLSLFDILVSVNSDHLEFTITFPSEVAHRGKIENMAQAWKSQLLCAADLHRESFKVSPLTLLDCRDDISATLQWNNINDKKDIQSVYWVSDLQQHMLSSQARHSQFYRVVGKWRLKSLGITVDTRQLQDAWSQVVSNHPGLRTRFVYSEAKKRYLAVVLNHDSSNMVSSKEPRFPNVDRIPESSDDDAKVLLPPCQIIVQESDDSGISFSLEFSHAIMDASSRSVLLEELIDAIRNRPLLRDNSNYLTYLQNRALHQSSCSIPIEINSIFPPDLHCQDTGLDTVSSLVVPPGLYATKMTDVCSQLGVTVSSLIFTAWSMVLSKFVGKDDVSFAYVASNRSADISGIERFVGLYVDLPIFRVDVGPHNLLWDLARHIQQLSANHLLDQSSFLDASQNPQNGHANGQINTLVNVRNTGVDSLELQRDGLELSMQGFEDPWDYDLVLAVDIKRSNELSCRIEYRSSIMSQNLVQKAAKSLGTTLDALLKDPQLSKQTWKSMST